MTKSKITVNKKPSPFLKHYKSTVFWICLILLFSNVPSLHTQQQRFHFDRLSLNEGLSQSIINVIHRDQKGFLWIGTQSGLNKYDGYDFKIYKQNPFDSTSISDNLITSIYEDRSGDLWIGTNAGGLNWFDSEKETFRHFRNIADDSTSISKISFCLSPVTARDTFG